MGGLIHSILLMISPTVILIAAITILLAIHPAIAIAVFFYFGLICAVVVHITDWTMPRTSRLILMRVFQGLPKIRC